ncbi:MAG: hypothetical protein WA830_08025 [Candidatus Sulfotelmatobacter sp.]
MKKELVELRVNGRAHELAIEPSALLFDVLRSQRQITGGNGTRSIRHGVKRHLSQEPRTEPAAIQAAAPSVSRRDRLSF